MSTLNAGIINAYNKLKVPVYTGAQRDAMSPAAEVGLIIYNSSIQNLQV